MHIGNLVKCLHSRGKRFLLMLNPAWCHLIRFIVHLLYCSAHVCLVFASLPKGHACWILKDQFSLITNMFSVTASGIQLSHCQLNTWFNNNYKLTTVGFCGLSRITGSLLSLSNVIVTALSSIFSSPLQQKQVWHIKNKSICMASYC